MGLREHKLWPLIEEVGLKRLWMHTIGATRVPNDINKLKTTLKKYVGVLRTDYEETIKHYANEALKQYGKILTWTEVPRGFGFNYDIPPATRRLYEALQKERGKK